MKKCKLSIILLIIILIGFSSLILIFRNVKASPIPYIYPATYDFRDEAVDTSEDDIGLIDSVVATDSVYSAVIIASEDGHKKVLEVNASGNNGKYTMYYHNFSVTQTSATIEYLIKFIDNGTGSYYYVISDASNNLVQLLYDCATNLFRCYHAAGFTIVAVTADTWTHIKVKFDTGTDHQWVWVNGDVIVSDVAFLASVVSNGLTKCRWQTYGAVANNNLQYYVDAYGESWDTNYDVGDNLIPLPIWSNLIESDDPLEIGLNETISINIHDDYNISSVFIEINKINYTMINISNTYLYSDWLPKITGFMNYKIWIIDEYENIASISGSILIQNTPYIILSILILFGLIFLMLYLYVKTEDYEPILIVFLFSLIIGTMSLPIINFPFTPWFQIFFLLFQTVLFLLKALEYYNNKRG